MLPVRSDARELRQGLVDRGELRGHRVTHPCVPAYDAAVAEVAFTIPVADERRAHPAHPWMRNVVWDGVWMLSALWLVPLVVILARGSDDPSTGTLDDAYCWLSAFLWLAHRVGSTWLAYGTTAYRPLVRAQPGRFVLAPAVIAVVCFGVLLPADGTLPWSRVERVMALAILDYVCVTYHFASQHFGVLCLYRAQTGRRDPSHHPYALVVGGVLVVVAEIVAGTVAFIDVWIDPWLDPDRVAAAAGMIAQVAMLVTAAATAGMLVLEARSARPSLPRALYVAGLGAMVVLAFQMQMPFVFVVLWTTQHWLVATGLTTLVAEHEPAPDGAGWRTVLHAINRRPYALLVLLVATSVLLLPFLEVEAVGADGAHYAERIFGAFAVALRTSVWTPALVALGFTTGFWHYWLDRAVYRFSDARVRAAACGLFREPRGGRVAPFARSALPSSPTP